LTVPLISVVIPTKDRAGYIRQAHASVAALRGDDMRLEIIVADNGSKDGTFDVAREFGAIVVQMATPGAAAARNAGIRAAKGDYIAFLDDDDVWLPGHLRPHLAMLQARPDFDAVVGQVQLTDQQLEWRSQPYPSSMPDSGDLFATLLGAFQQIGATVVRTRVRESVGYLDESLLAAEDWDWHMRIALAHKVGFVAVPCVLFRQRPYGTYDELGWQRLGFTRRVFMRNWRRAGKRRPGLLRTVRSFVRLSGPFYDGFVFIARDRFRRGERRSGMLALARAVWASPAHAARAILWPRSPLWGAIGDLVRGKQQMP
jgi:glycosyltransferase involved in cell wall biosynthesis